MVVLVRKKLIVIILSHVNYITVSTSSQTVLLISGKKCVEIGNKSLEILKAY